MLTVLVLILSVFIIISFYLIGRLIAVCDYRIELVQRTGLRYEACICQAISPEEANYYYDIWESIIVKGPSTRELVFSFKKLKDEYWFTEEQINFLNGTLI